MRRRREWFTRMADAYLVLWWIPAGELPTLADARERVEHLREHGPAPFAFTFKQRFPSPDERAAPGPVLDEHEHGEGPMTATQSARRASKA